MCYLHHNGFLIFEQRLRENKNWKNDSIKQGYSREGYTSEFLFCRNQQYQWQ
jgi:hypothetical protein